MYEYSELVLFIRPRTQTAALRRQSGSEPEPSGPTPRRGSEPLGGSTAVHHIHRSPSAKPISAHSETAWGHSERADERLLKVGSGTLEISSPSNIV